MADKVPAFQFYPGDWRKDLAIQSLSYHDRGVWHEIFCLMHESEQRGVLLLNGKPMPIEVLARVLGLDKQSLERTLEILLSYGVATKDDKTGALMCEWMVKQEHLRRVRKEAGKKGGNPNLLNQNPNQKVSKPSSKNQPLHLSSSSSSSLSHTGERGLSMNGSERELEAMLETIRLGYGTNDLPKREKWIPLARRAIDKNISAELLVKAYKQLKQEPRNFEISPQNVYDRALEIEVDVRPVLDISKCPDCEGIGLIYLNKGGAKQCKHLPLTEMN